MKILLINKSMIINKEKTLINLKKANSLTAKIIEMIEQDNYCIDIMQQNLAVIGLLRSAHEMLMENHLNSCFKNAMSSTNEKKKQQMTEEILKVTKLFNK
jgi:DNA-binding FrmR family transcriptional regulator